MAWPMLIGRLDFQSRGSSMFSDDQFLRGKVVEHLETYPTRARLVDAAVKEIDNAKSMIAGVRLAITVSASLVVALLVLIGSGIVWFLQDRSATYETRNMEFIQLSKAVTSLQQIVAVQENSRQYDHDLLKQIAASVETTRAVQRERHEPGQTK